MDMRGHMQWKYRNRLPRRPRLVIDGRELETTIGLKYSIARETYTVMSYMNERHNRRNHVGMRFNKSDTRVWLEPCRCSGSSYARKHIFVRRMGTNPYK